MSKPLKPVTHKLRNRKILKPQDLETLEFSNLGTLLTLKPCHPTLPQNNPALYQVRLPLMRSRAGGYWCGQTVLMTPTPPRATERVRHSFTPTGSPLFMCKY